MARSQVSILDSGFEDPGLAARTLAALRYWWWLALGALLLGSFVCFFASRYLAQCFQSSVVIGFPVVGQTSTQAVLGSIDQIPAIEGLSLQPESDPTALSRLETLLRREFLRIQLSFDPIATTVPNSVALRVSAKDKTPEAASALAVAAGQAVLDQAEARLIPGGHLPAASAPAPSPPPSSAPVPAKAPSPLPLRKVVTWKAAPESAELAENKRRLSDQLADEANRRSKLQRDLGVLAAMPPVPLQRFSAVRASNEAALKSELNGANNTLIELQNRYTNLHPDVVAAQQRVRDLQAELEQAINKNTVIAKQNAAAQTSFNEAHARLAREAALQQQITELSAQMASDSAELEALGKSKKWIPVVRYVASGAPAAPAPATATAATPSAPLAVPSPEPQPLPQPALQLPQSTLAPSTPVATLFLTQPILAALSTLFGILLALALVWFAELTSRSVKDADLLEDELPYGVRFLGEIPRMMR